MATNQELYYKRVRELASENQELKQRITNELVAYKMRKRQLEKDNNELLLRLSSIAGARLVDNNPNITDLSNQNRPSKLAEQFSELYDNEWTDAFDVLTAGGRRTTQDACYMLLKIVCMAATLCQDKSGRDLTQMKNTVFIFCGAENVEIIRRLKENRKQTYQAQMKGLRKELTRRLKTVLTKEDRRPIPVKLYVRKCLTITWLMAIQDPPVYMDSTLDAHGNTFDVKLYRAFTKSGKYIDYMVWPVVHLVKNGALLSKGIAQGSNCIQPANASYTDAKNFDIPNIVPSESDAYEIQDTVEDHNEAVGNNSTIVSESQNAISTSSIGEQSIMAQFQKWNASNSVQ